MNPGSINLKAVEGPFDSCDSDSSCVIPIESSRPVSLMITILGFKLVSAVRYSAWCVASVENQEGKPVVWIGVCLRLFSAARSTLNRGSVLVS
jgi:hypothetical protein